MRLAERYAAAVTDHSRLVIAAVLVATLVVGAGAGSVDGGLTIAGFSSDSAEAAALDDIERNFSVAGENTTTAQVVVRGDNVLTRESLLDTLRFQRAIREDESINATLRDDQPTLGVSNVVATAAYYESRGGGGPPPSLDAQIDQLESMSEAEVEATVDRVLDPEADTRGDPYALLATSYEPGSTTASGRILLVYQDTTGAAADSLPEDVTAAQLELRELADTELSATDHFVFAPGIVDEESGQATGESFALISPVALLLILTVLGIAYRDAIDVLLGLLGVALVLVWMAGFLGWAGIGITQILIAVPFLLIGLSIDYALHVVMRYREASVDDPGLDPRAAMRRGLAGVVVAIGAATFTTAVGFLSNAVSPIASIREFGLVSGFGIAAAFVVFGLLFPALKLEIDGLRGRLGWPPNQSPFGRGERVGRLLSVGPELARRAPYVVIAVAVVLAAGGGVAATGIDTTLDQTAFLPQDSPDWMNLLPAALQPSDYDIKANAVYLNENFVQSRGGSQAEFLIRGPVTDPGTLDAIAAGHDALRETDSAAVRADGSLQATGPLATIEAVAAENETVAAMVDDADTDGDGVPDGNLAAIYDAVYDADPAAAAETIHRENGEYRSLRLSVALSGTTDTRTITKEMRGVATEMESGSDLNVIATGSPITSELVQRSLLRTLVEGFLITFGVILAFLAIIFRLRYGSATLGAVVLFPVVLAQAWLFGTMYLADLAFTTETAIIAAIGIGIGVDYAIHIGERFVDERGAGREPIDALTRTVEGTGGALLASAATTTAGFGVLALALVPSLQRFGFITAVAITYAFLASVLVLPSLLTVWERLDGTTADTSA
ncbi:MULTISPECIES: efflux RND transporter permease subunit [Halolamina]|uniref:Predicted exporter protein, RND superfamily n=1 Tax=Halolamina pelagica TaxID=699431 RepID=A0A1I5MUV0_9EURY|nr:MULTISPECIES: MMPL family transporter [Halolamina]NHX36169.1 MMPL family transporter [Halolamina sp. R1-12]SFP13315.1 Predicted exporter protein, RND superfamily [Halolamina pelagica]